MSEAAVFTASRLIRAPREAVWHGWTAAAALARWFAPKGAALHVEALAFRPGGRFHYALVLPDGQRVWGLVRFHAIAAPERLVQVQCFSDAAGGIARNPRNAAWPLETLSVAAFAAQEGGTLVTMTARPQGENAAERRCWMAAFPAMQAGWGGTFDRLAAYLAQQQDETRQRSTMP